MFQKKHPVVLVAPLDWGLGHATRCIPIINHLLSIKCEVIIASEGLQKALLKEEFPHLTYLELVGYRLTFGKNTLKTILKIIWQIPRILMVINKENLWLNKFLNKNKVDAIISDNRYGLFSSKVPSVFITHQLTIKTPFGKLFENGLRRLNYRFIQKFSECWIPDLKSNINMGGTLSHPAIMPLISVKYLGRLSRIRELPPSAKKITLLIILSGPEPQRSIFEEMLLLQLRHFKQPVVLVRGLPGESKIISNPGNDVSIYNHLSTDRLTVMIANASFIISRSGYSTVMDVIPLNKKCIFVPTPGQTEQEYLAHYLTSKGICLEFKQNEFFIDKALAAARQKQFVRFDHSDNEQYKQVVTSFIMNLKVKA